MNTHASFHTRACQPNGDISMRRPVHAPREPIGRHQHGVRIFKRPPRAANAAPLAIPPWKMLRLSGFSKRDAGEGSVRFNRRHIHRLTRHFL
jgi:hypothetical protein